MLLKKYKVTLVGKRKMKPVQKEGQTDVLGQKVENCDQCFLNKTGISKRFGFLNSWREILRQFCGTVLAAQDGQKA